MALLHIAEPGFAPAPHQQKFALGIDLGTTNSLFATVRNGSAEILLDENEQALTPSVVYFSPEKCLVGQEALAMATFDPTNTIISAKRLIGRSLADIQERYDLPYHFSANENGLPVLHTACGEKSPVEVSAEILKKLRQLAQKRLGNDIAGVVITVPAYFDDAQRQSTKDAGKLAGLNVLRLLNEPTAAAIAYGLESQQEGVIAVYDLGGGTFDISILRLSKGVFEVLATGGDTALGGDDFDNLLAQWIIEASHIQPTDVRQKQALLLLAKTLKEQLSRQERVTITYQNWTGEIHRETFNSLIASLIKRTLVTCRRALKDAKLKVEDIQNVIMVGGATRVPFVCEQVAEFFQRQPLSHIDPDKVVALGASIQADILVGNKPHSDMLLLDVIPLSLGIETMGGLVEKIIPRNTTIPVAKAQEFTTFKDGQTAMRVHVVQGERELVSDCRSLAHLSLKGIPPMVAGGAVVRVTYQVDADGLLSVTAMEKSTGISANVQVKPSYGLTDKEITHMLKTASQHAKADIAHRQHIEQCVEARRVIDAVESALVKDKHLLNPQELQHIHQCVANLNTLCQTGTTAEIKQGIKALDNATQAFANRRMDQSISHALAGQAIENLDK